MKDLICTESEFIVDDGDDCGDRNKCDTFSYQIIPR